MEAAMKMARQYYMELSPKQPQRMNFIARKGSYHGSTLGSLSMSGHVGRRKLFEGMLFDNIHRVSAAYEYRGRTDGQTTDDYVQQLADELDQKFQEVGPDTVCAFVAESVVGAVSIYIFPMFISLTDCVATVDPWHSSCACWLFQGYEKGVRQVWSTPHLRW